MTKKRLQNIFNVIKKFFTPLKSHQIDDNYFRLGPKLEPYATQRRIETGRTGVRVVSRRSIDEFIPSDDEVEKINRGRLEQAKLSQTYEEMAQAREALNLTLNSQHRLLIATLLTALVALIVGIISLNNKPPEINIQLPDAYVKTTSP